MRVEFLWKVHGERHGRCMKILGWRLVKELALFWCHEPVVETEPAV